MDPAATLGANFTDVFSIVDLVLWLALALTAWVLAGLPGLADLGLVGRANIPYFPFEGDDRRFARRVRTWAFRGGAIGATLAILIRTIFVPPTPAASPAAYELARSFGPWPWLGLIALGVAVGATLAAAGGSHPATSSSAELREFIPRPVVIAAIAAAALAVAAVVTMTVVDSGNPLVPAVVSAAASVISVVVLLLGWRRLVARTPRGISAGWADVARATAIGAWAVLPLIGLVATVAQLVQSRVPTDLPEGLGEYAGIVHANTFVGLLSIPVSVLLIGYAVMLSPLWVVKTRHPAQWAANRAAAVALQKLSGPRSATGDDLASRGFTSAR